jgi:ComEC/Rec2-related protein
MQASLLRLWLVTVGVAAGASTAASTGTDAALGALAIALAGVAMRRRPALLLLALFLFGYGSGVVAGRVRNDEGEVLKALAREVRFCEVTGEVLEEAGGLGTLARLDRVTCQNEMFVQPGVVVLETTAPAGSAFSASGWVLPLGSDTFDVARSRAGAHAELAADDVRSAPPGGARAVAASIRQGLRDAGEHISAEEAGLIRGLTIGDTGGLSRVTIERFRRAGLSHLLAVSGSNVAIVLAGVAVLASRMSFRTRVAAGAGALLLFVLVVGPDASVLRAAAMGAVGLVALATGRQAEPLHALGVALMMIILLRPQIVFAVGLHLSVAATAGIILWASRIHRSLPLPALISLPLAVTLSAQVAVLPLLLGVFGEASLVAPLTNLLAAAAVPPATVLGLTAALVGSLHPWWGGLILQAAEPFAGWILLVGRLGAEPEWATFAVPSWMGLVAAAPVCIVGACTLRGHGAPISLDR